MLSVRYPPPLIASEVIYTFLWNSDVRSCHWRWPRRPTFDSVASTIPKWRTFKLLRWKPNLHQSTWNTEELRLETTCDSWADTCVTMRLVVAPAV
jgi:hypothetical protein